MGDRDDVPTGGCGEGVAPVAIGGAVGIGVAPHPHRRALQPEFVVSDADWPVSSVTVSRTV